MGRQYAKDVLRYGEDIENLLKVRRRRYGWPRAGKYIERWLAAGKGKDLTEVTATKDGYMTGLRPAKLYREPAVGNDQTKGPASGRCKRYGGATAGTAKVRRRYGGGMAEEGPRRGRRRRRVLLGYL